MPGLFFGSSKFNDGCFSLAVYAFAHCYNPPRSADIFGGSTKVEFYYEFINRRFVVLLNVQRMIPCHCHTCQPAGSLDARATGVSGTEELSSNCLHVITFLVVALRYCLAVVCIIAPFGAMSTFFLIDA